MGGVVQEPSGKKSQELLCLFFTALGWSGGGAPSSWKPLFCLFPASEVSAGPHVDGWSMLAVSCWTGKILRRCARALSRQPHPGERAEADTPQLDCFFLVFWRSSSFGVFHHSDRFSFENPNSPIQF